MFRFLFFSSPCPDFRSIVLSYLSQWPVLDSFPGSFFLVLPILVVVFRRRFLPRWLCHLIAYLLRPSHSPGRIRVLFFPHIPIAVGLLCLVSLTGLLFACGLGLAMLHIDLFLAAPVLLVLFPLIRLPILFALLCLSCPFLLLLPL